MTKMNECTINALFGIVSDPIKNAYDINNKKQLAEAERIVRIFNISNAQKSEMGEISARSLVAFKMLVSNN